MNITTALALALPLLAGSSSPRETLYPLLSGAWTGALEYQEYQPPHDRIRRPATATIETAPDGSSVVLHFVFDDGGKVVKSDERLALDASGDTLVWGSLSEKRPQSYTVRAMITTGGSTTLTAEGEGNDDGQPVTLRETFTIGADSIQILREVRRKGGAAFAFRHVYTFRRKP